MFRTLFKGTHIKQFYRKFSQDNIPTFIVFWSEKDGINVEIKEKLVNIKKAKSYKKDNSL